MGPKNVSKASLELNITVPHAFSDLRAHTNVVRNAFALPLAVVPSRLVDVEFGPQNVIFSSFVPTVMGPKNVSKTSLEPKITAKNAFSDLGAHTNVVRNAFALPLAVVPSRLVDIEF